MWESIKLYQTQEDEIIKKRPKSWRKSQKLKEVKRILIKQKKSKKLRGINEVERHQKNPIRHMKSELKNSKKW